MKKLNVFLATLLVLGMGGVFLVSEPFNRAGNGVALADLPEGTVLRLVGAVKIGSQVGTASGGATATSGTITTSKVKVRRIVVSAGGTATNVGFVNADTIAEGGATNYIIDVSAVANTTTILDFTDAPLDFSAGCSVGGSDQNATGVSIYQNEQE